ncbi:MAG: D-alanyl-D-alanine carboxypeptidase, partial [Aeromonas sp.]|nr:D-alanyl-D-alanine carboxypeptidase [Aeromonas sp.]
MSKFARSVILASLLSATAQANQPVPTPDSALPTAQPVPTLNSAPMVVPAAPEISAKAHILIDYYSGQVLAEQNAEERLPPASLTKMMTSYIIGQELLKGNIKRTDMVTISQNAWSKNYSDSSKM